MSAITAPVAWPAHIKWLKSAIDDPKRALYIARQDQPIGSGRIDQLDDCVELSWTIAPEHRGAGLGAALVCALIDRAPDGAVIAQIKSANGPSLALARRHHFEWRSTSFDMETWILLKSQL
jgi:RimJ/RimL family protein N-acetyltransferase